MRERFFLLLVGVTLIIFWCFVGFHSSGKTSSLSFDTSLVREHKSTVELVMRILAEQDDRLRKVEKLLGQPPPDNEYSLPSNFLSQNKPTLSSELFSTSKEYSPPLDRFIPDLSYKPDKKVFEEYHVPYDLSIFDQSPVVDIPNEEKSELLSVYSRIQYWKRSRDNFKPIIPRFLSWKIHDSGFNNRRMSLETAWAMAYATNRTFVLHPPERLVPFHEIGYDEKFWEVDAMKRVWPTLTYKEFQNLPNFNEISKDVIYLNWTDVPQSECVFALPYLQAENSTDYSHYKKWRLPRKPTLPSNGRVYSYKTHPIVKDAPYVFLDTVLFTHYYIFVYPNPISGITPGMINMHVRDGIRYRDEIFWITAKIIRKMPEQFSTVHYRRGDLDYSTRNITPKQVLENVEKLLQKEETIYVATDEDPRVFKSEFTRVWEEKNFSILSFNKFKYLIPPKIDPKWIPLIETIICSQGRIFVGTHFSTFTNYIHRIRGHSDHIKNKKFYYTDKMYANTHDHQSEDYNSWDREFSKGWVVDDVVNSDNI